METTPKNLLSFFVSFFTSQASDASEANQVVQKMLRNKRVQEIIIKAMYKLDSILTESLVSIRSPSLSKTQTNPVRQTRLLTLAKDIKQQMENYSMLQEKLDSVKGLVESLNDSVEPVPQPSNTSLSHSEDLVNFLSKIAGKSRTSNFEIEAISDDTWTKHLEVEKMLTVEMEKYYNHLDSVESRYFQRLLGVKFKTAKKIQALECEIERTWQHFRILVDQAAMSFEDKLSKEAEIFWAEQKVLEVNTTSEMPVKDFNTAVAKIKNLFTVRKILEKRKVQDEKLVSGLNSKISILNQKITELVNTNMTLIENCTSLSWCLEFIFNRSEMPEAVKSKALRLLEKQKCTKLEALFKIDNILEKYSVETVSKKFQDLKEGLVSVSNSLKDENMKIKLSRLINESHLDEIDKTEALKHIRPVSHAVNPPRSKGANRKENPKPTTPKSSTPKATTPKDLPKMSALERMRKAMMSIDEEIKDADKYIEDVLNEPHHKSNSSIFEGASKEKPLKVKIVSNKNITKASVSPKSLKSNVRTEGSSYMLEDLTKEHKETQVLVEFYTRETQMDMKIFETINSIIRPRTGKSKVVENVSHEELETFIIDSCRSKVVKKIDKIMQTDKEPGVFEFAAPSSSMIRGIMNKIRNPKSDKSLKSKEPINPNVADNLIITKMRNPKEDSLFKTEISEVVEETNEKYEKYEIPPSKLIQEDQRVQDSHRSSLNPELSSRNLSKQSNLALPVPNFSNIITNFSKITSSKLVRISQTPALIRAKDEDLELASEHYKKEFSLQAQLQGLKKMTFEDIQKVWEEVINRRIVEGENDKISIYLRGYLGTDKFESEKSKVISYMTSQSGYIKKLSPLRISQESVLANWKKLMLKFFEKLAFNFKSKISEKDSPREILFKVAKNLKFIKHRLPERFTRSISVTKKKAEPMISYNTDKWSLNSTSVSPMESLRKVSRGGFLKKNKGYPRLMSKTPIRDKFTLSESGKLPLL